MNVLPAGQTEQRRDAARQARSLVKEGLADMRRAVAALRPAVLESFSLPVAIYSVVNARPRGELQRSGAGRKGGQGLAGLKERAAMLGGRFEAGPDDEGGFRVMMELPLAI